MKIEENFSLRHLNSFGIDAKARFFAAFDGIDQLADLIAFGKSMHVHEFILGGGSNVLLTGDLDKLVLKNDMAGIEWVGEDPEFVFIKAGAGENWHRFVIYCIDLSLGGVENLSLIPGNVGAGPMQNIGAYGVELKDVFHELEAYHIDEGILTTFTAADCAFGYRESVFKNKYKGQFVITSVTFRLRKHPVFNTSYGAIEEELARMQVNEKTIRAVSQAVINIRQSKLPDPAVIGNAGSFFKNPEVSVALFNALKLAFPNLVGYPLPGDKVKLAAGWLIEQCGWKGYRRGDAGCHARQALVLVNYGAATGQQVFDLSEQIVQSVQAKFGVTLEREVNIL